MSFSPKHRQVSNNKRLPLFPRLDVLVSSHGAPHRRTRPLLKPRKQSARSIYTKTSLAFVANHDAAEETTLPLGEAAHYSLDDSSFSTPVGRSCTTSIPNGRSDLPLPAFPVLPCPNASGGRTPGRTDGATPPRLKLMPRAIALAPRAPINMMPRAPYHGALSHATLVPRAPVAQIPRGVYYSVSG